MSNTGPESDGPAATAGRAGARLRRAGGAAGEGPAA